MRKITLYNASLLAMVFIILSLMGCAEVRKVAEPIDRAACELDCKRAGLMMSRYIYETDACWCALPLGGEVKAREFLAQPR